MYTAPQAELIKLAMAVSTSGETEPNIPAVPAGVCPGA